MQFRLLFVVVIPFVNIESGFIEYSELLIIYSGSSRVIATIGAMQVFLSMIKSISPI